MCWPPGYLGKVHDTGFSPRPPPGASPRPDPYRCERMSPASQRKFYISLQGYLAHKKQRPPRTLQQGCAVGPVVVLGGEVGGVLSEVTL